MQQVFVQLGYYRQIALYKQAALQALRAYDLLGGSVRLESVTFVNHATFKVTVSIFHLLTISSAVDWTPREYLIGRCCID